MPDALYPWMHILGRILLSAIFILSGINHFTKLNPTAAYAKSRGVPLERAAVVISGVMIVVGGVLVLLGWHRFIGAALLFVFLIFAAVLVHGFWKETDPMAKAGEMAHFMKDIALAGAALFIAYYAGSEWPLSLGG